MEKAEAVVPVLVHPGMPYLHHETFFLLLRGPHISKGYQPYSSYSSAAVVR
jgi:hypothetical protein